jgi:hypothetical protein
LIATGAQLPERFREAYQPFVEKMDAAQQQVVKAMTDDVTLKPPGAETAQRIT